MAWRDVAWRHVAWRVRRVSWVTSVDAGSTWTECIFLYRVYRVYIIAIARIIHNIDCTRWQGHHSSPPSQQLDEKTVEEEQEEMVVADQVEPDEDGRVVDVEEVQKV